MKRYLIILITLLSFANVYSQRIEAGFNTGIGVEFGYSNVYNPINKDLQEPEHLFTCDFTMFGCYLGFGYGTETIYQDRGYYDTYTENLNTYIFRIGPSFRIGGFYAGLNITPYIGTIINSYSEELNTCGYYYDPYGNWRYHNHNCTIYEDTYNYNFLYGIKLSINYNLFSISGHISNRDTGVSIGFYIN